MNETEIPKTDEITTNADGEDERPRGGSLVEELRETTLEEALGHINEKMAKVGFNKRALRRGLQDQLKRNKVQEFDLAVLAEEVTFWKGVVKSSDTRTALIAGFAGSIAGIVMFCILVGTGL